ncbi:PAS domain S-box protein [Natrarchaeobius oligotrophus]|uniref:histidine kinase n=1 Tax=Natrarchaeobius chitinivorans TaxID=1679083 RepID=A0A3N6MZH2_NATCH|nr:PAS domain-containing sensor histidine kinase [Natrarchaeobius chitinivorans]RQH03561.1 PAS domain-containing sensor histidine kinase [Natrarchaeobius chitinivorans]
MGSENPRLTSVLDSLTIGVTLHDPETDYLLDANDRVEQLFGYSKEELRRMTFEDFTAVSVGVDKDEIRHQIRTAAGGEPRSFELQIERENGEFRWVTVHLSRTTIDESVYVIGQITDITEYRVREQLLHLLNRVIRHNLRNDMNLLVGYADRVKTAIENDQLEEEIETISDIATEVGTLSDSLDQIENIVKPGATQREPTNLRSVVQTRAAKFRRDYSEVDLTVDAPSDVWVIADNGLQYAIDNAIENAIEHTDQEVPEVTLMIGNDPENNQGVVQIADNGPPIPDIEVDVLDDETKASSTYHGSGVGLWVMKWCVDSLGGALSFKENEPRGNLVQISLPTASLSADGTQ